MHDDSPGSLSAGESISNDWRQPEQIYDACDIDENELQPEDDTGLYYQEFLGSEEEEIYNEFEITNPISNEMGLDSTLHLDFTELLEGQGYDSEQGSNRIPHRLLEILVHPKESLVYLALCGVSIVGYQPKLLDETIFCLNEYLNRCMKKEYINEASYISQIISNIKEERKGLHEFEKQPTTTEVNEDLEAAIEKRAREESEWKQIETQLDAERDVAVSECEIRRQEKLDALRVEWSSHNKKRQFNKPSSYLTDLRTQAKKNLRAHRFKEALEIQAVIIKREEDERRESENRMNEAYKRACDRIEDEFQRDLRNVEGAFEKRKLAVDRQKELAMQPYKQRVCKIERKKVQLEEQATIMSRCTTSLKNRGFITAQHEIQPLKTRSSYCAKIGSFNAKLSLPMLKPAKKKPLRASSNMSALTRPITNSRRIETEPLNRRRKSGL